jgi:hypothetical protein
MNGLYSLLLQCYWHHDLLHVPPVQDTGYVGKYVTDSEWHEECTKDC